MELLGEISVYNESESFELIFNSTKNYFPGYRTKELIYGRKCFEMKWLEGDCSIEFGFIRDFYRIHFYGGLKTNPRFYIRRSGQGDVTQNIPTIVANVPYLTCIDTKEKRLDLIQNTTHLSFNYPKDFPNKMQASIYAGISNKFDRVEWRFRNFETKLPSAFFTLSDKRHFDSITCNIRSPRYSSSFMRFALK